MNAIGDAPTAFPLCWPPDKARVDRSRRDKFSPALTIDRARRELRDELRRLGARNVVVSTNEMFTRDGRPAFRQPLLDADPAAALYFDLGGERRQLSCDVWNRLQANLWALAKMIDARRGIERWGGTEEMYASFATAPALPAGASAQGWWKVLGVAPSASLEQVYGAYRALARQHHPDVGGDPERFMKITEAFEAGKAARG